MDALTAAEVTAARASLSTMLPDSGTIQRVARTSDGAGGFTEAWSTVATVPCRLTRITTRPGPGGAFRHAAERLNDETTHMVAFAAGTDVRLTDHVQVAGLAYEVVFVRTGGLWELQRHAEVKETPA